MTPAVTTPVKKYQQVTWAHLQQNIEDALTLAPKQRVLQTYFAQYPLIDMVLATPTVGYIGIDNDDVDVSAIEETYKKPIKKRKICITEFEGLQIPYVTGFFNHAVSLAPDLSYPNTLAIHLTEIFRVLKENGTSILWLPLASTTEVTQAMATIEASNFYCKHKATYAVTHNEQLHPYSLYVELEKPVKEQQAAAPTVTILPKRVKW